MKPTNYHLFDFVDFDTELSRDESLWKAYKPTAVYEKDGDVCVTVPFQKQQLANDMAADTTVPQEEYTLIIRQYSTGITRLFLGFGEYELTDRSEMLQFSERIRKVPLSVWAYTATGNCSRYAMASTAFSVGIPVSQILFSSGTSISMAPLEQIAY